MKNLKKYLPLIIFFVIAGGVLIIVLVTRGSKKEEKAPETAVVREKEPKREATRSAEASPSATMEASPSMDLKEATISADIVNLNTEKGVIKIKLDVKAAPKFVENFLEKIAKKFYEGLTFHRVEDWVVQGGDPKGNGTGGAAIETELSEDRQFLRGSVGVARGGNIKISNDSQFFILKEDSEFLNNQYTWFGEVIEGMKVVDSIEIGDKIIEMTPQ